ncbi:MAG TPA: OmpA family protein [Ignavibacteria bacterium]
MNLSTFFNLLLVLILFIQVNNTNAQQLENLGKNINSEQYEIAPIISPDGTTLYFVRARIENDKIYQDEYFSIKDSNNNWLPCQKMDEPFGGDEINVLASISPDGNKILVFKGNKNKEFGFYFYYKTKTGWVKLKELKIINFNNILKNTSFLNASLSSSGKVLIMSFSKSKEQPFYSLYVSFLNIKDNSWSEPQILPSNINIAEGKKGNWIPFIAPDDATLYFSSDRNGGYGGSDIYMSKRLDDTWLKWSQPQNMGDSINTSSDDGYYSVSAKGDYAFVSSHMSGFGKSDIFRIKLPEKVKPNPVVLVSGKVLNTKNNLPVDAKISYSILPEGTEAGIASSHPSDGSYKIVLPYGKKYSFIATADGFYSISNFLDLTEIKEYKEMNINIDMKPIEIGETVRLNNIFFDFNKSILKPESFQELDRVVKLLNENPKIEIEISGHTDNVGTDEYNLTLSIERANSVVAYIISKGISQTIITAKGYGKSVPVATNDTEEGRQLNRRVEFRILKK